jgi:hypothetical protein
MWRALYTLLIGLCYAITFRRPDCTGPHLYDDDAFQRPGRQE